MRCTDALLGIIPRFRDMKFHSSVPPCFVQHTRPGAHPLRETGEASTEGTAGTVAIVERQILLYNIDIPIYAYSQYVV